MGDENIVTNSEEATPPVTHGEIREPHVAREEVLRRKERVRKLLGAMLGGGYGLALGGAAGGTSFGRRLGEFNRADAVRGALLGMLAGAGAGAAGGAILNRLKRYEGAHGYAEPASVQIVVQPSPDVVNLVQDAIKSGEAARRALSVFRGSRMV